LSYKILSVLKEKKIQKFYSAKLNTVGKNINIDFGDKGFFYQKINENFKNK